MHIFNMAVTYLQSVEKIQWKLQDKLISQYTLSTIIYKVQLS